MLGMLRRWDKLDYTRPAANRIRVTRMGRLPSVIERQRAAEGLPLRLRSKREDCAGACTASFTIESPQSQADNAFALQKRRNVRHRARYVGLLLSYRSHVVNRAACSLGTFQTCDDPLRQILRLQAPACGRDVSPGCERPVEHSYTGFFDPRSGGQVGAGGNTVQQAQFREYQRA